MDLSENFSIAIGSLKTNKLRAALTTLGIVIGVSTVISMMTIIQGINSYVSEQFAEIGANTFFIQKYPAINTGHERRKFRNRKDIKTSYAEIIKNKATLVSNATPSIYTWGEVIKGNSNKTNADVLVQGVSEDWMSVEGRYVKDGRFFIGSEVNSRRKVCVVGIDIVEKLFPFKNIIGESVYISGKKFKVVGVFEEKGSIFGQSQDNIVVMPYTTFESIFGKDNNVTINVQAKTPELIVPAMDEVIGILRTIRKVPPGKPNDFEIITKDTLADTWKNLTSVIFAAAIGIAMISLLVGGIGIMNIMLVSVTERTKEIGIRKAIGAKRKDILNQFIVEAVILAGFGGIIGVSMGLLLGAILGAVSPLPSAVPVWAIFAGLGFSSMVGLFFGIYPAAKAAKLDPIVALRYE